MLPEPHMGGQAVRFSLISNSGTQLNRELPEIRLLLPNRPAFCFAAFALPTVGPGRQERRDEGRQRRSTWSIRDSLGSPFASRSIYPKYLECEYYYRYAGR